MNEQHPFGVTSESPSTTLEALATTTDVVSQLQTELAIWKAPDDFINFMGLTEARPRVFVVECPQSMHNDEPDRDTEIARAIAGELNWQYSRTVGAELAGRATAASLDRLDRAAKVVEHHQPIVWHINHADPLVGDRPEIIMNKLLSVVEPSYEEAAGDRCLLAVLSVSNLDALPESYLVVHEISPTHVIRR
jgi:hypothetical protein